MSKNSIISSLRGYLIKFNFVPIFNGTLMAEIIYDKIQFSYPTGVNARNLEAKGWIGSEEYILIDSCAENDRIRGVRITNDKSTYERYGGSYAQDEMGYSDDDIDTIFDGDPSAYWNID